MNVNIIRRANSPSCYIGLILKRQRKKLGLSGSEVAKLLHISQQQVSRYERGLTSFNVNVLLRFFSVLNMNEREIITIFDELITCYMKRNIQIRNTI
ncbi:MULTISPECIES: helix-turn-helix domain-containing protein [Providencia]|uniref:XRE family transcriptional regulator n=1 Tax=Providencia rettgeri TaxID=587 RepID=A0AAP2JW64_PRORE|nr:MULTISPECIES: helix-turn-helix transcriptional regulator [Providencia]MBX6957362.1 XRE family transcriptional regulator [Providencia rettgeri]MBX6960104.1 XRE family transcriptional regulator [Providencia rettgeri]MBX6969226.1 XRE family transcriptional regulator [Providencia rettgeri]MBX6971036.1 XRE family transcriptional regulator [Providencia rettgeri]MBX6976389.1 XRE family transcriptional regulator [Providencia rettgeri]